MKKSANGNMYDVSAREVRELFADYLDGAALPLVLVLSRAPLAAAARQALESSARALGYGEDSCAFAVLEADGAALDANALFLLVEGLDPLCLVAADEDAARLLEAAYRQEVPTGAASRVFGRSAVAFRSFEAMLGTSDEKQRAWALLKKLSKRGE